MKHGFRIDIQTDLNDCEMKEAKRFSDDFIIRTLQSPNHLFGGIRSHGGRDTPYARGTCMCLKNGLFFLRINRHKRIFGVVRTDEVHGDYRKLKLKNLNLKMFTYAQWGDIQG